MISQGVARVATGIAILLGLAGGIVVYQLATRPAAPPHRTTVHVVTSAVSRLDTYCPEQYKQLSNGIDVPPIPTDAVIDLHRDAAEFRLYATPNGGATRQIVFDCSIARTGEVAANLTVSPGAGTDALGSVGTDAYYRDYLPDGSGALIGVAAPGTAAVAATDDVGDTLAVTFIDGYFVVWPPTGSLDGATVSITEAGGQVITYDEPTTLAGTFSDLAFQEACKRALLHETKPAFNGSTEAVFTIVASNTTLNVYVGNVTGVCTLDISQHVGGGFNFYTDRQPAGRKVYGMRSFVGSDSGFVVGFVPPGVTTVRIISGGTSIDASTANGVFAAWIPVAAFTDKKTRVIASSPSRTYTFTGVGSVKPG